MQAPHPRPDLEQPPAVFVYGTLLPGEARWHLLEPFAAAWAPATVAGLLWDTGLGYPAAVFATDGRIPGALVTLVPATATAALLTLDAVEGAGRLYRRVRVDTSGGPVGSYEWLGPVEGLRPLPDGWRPERRW